MDRESAETYVNDLYRHLLRRNPEDKERTYWTDALLNDMSERDVFEKFIRSVEYRRKYRVRCAFPDGHFHSPIVDPSQIVDYVRDVSRPEFLMQSGEISEINIDEHGMVGLWNRNASVIAGIPFTELPSDNTRYYCDNNVFPCGDAILLFVTIGECRPRRIIEIGSGYSTACMLDAADHFGLSNLELTCIEPYASRLKRLLRQNDSGRIKLIEQPVQVCPAELFEQLEPNDILFIDSTHVLKTGSDVHYELFTILPRLRDGVLIHFHDIQYPFEYPDEWLRKNFSWNEIYALRAFLMYNERFVITFFNSMFASRHAALVRSLCPMFLSNPGGSIWLKKLPEPKKRRRFRIG